MSNRVQLKGVKKSRKVGHRPKKNKKSVVERRRLRKELAKKLLKLISQGEKDILSGKVKPQIEVFDNIEKKI